MPSDCLVRRSPPQPSDRIHARRLRPPAFFLPIVNAGPLRTRKRRRESALGEGGVAACRVAPQRGPRPPSRESLSPTPRVSRWTWKIFTGSSERGASRHTGDLPSTRRPESHARWKGASEEGSGIGRADGRLMRLGRASEQAEAVPLPGKSLTEDPSPPARRSRPPSPSSSPQPLLPSA